MFLQPLQTLKEVQERAFSPHMLRLSPGVVYGGAGTPYALQEETHIMFDATLRGLPKLTRSTGRS